MRQYGYANVLMAWLIVIHARIVANLDHNSRLWWIWKIIAQRRLPSYR